MIKLTTYSTSEAAVPSTTWQNQESSSVGYEADATKPPVRINPDNVATITRPTNSATSDSYWRVNLLRLATAPGVDMHDWFVVTERDARRINNREMDLWV